MHIGGGRGGRAAVATAVATVVVAAAVIVVVGGAVVVAGWGIDGATDVGGGRRVRARAVGATLARVGARSIDRGARERGQQRPYSVDLGDDFVPERIGHLAVFRLEKALCQFRKAFAEKDEQFAEMLEYGSVFGHCEEVVS